MKKKPDNILNKAVAEATKEMSEVAKEIKAKYKPLREVR